jgi:transcriptional regulator with XRE-family HTH domain
MGMAARMLRHARRSAGLTQRALGAKTRVPQETIARIEAGRADPRVETLDRLLEGCGFGLEHLPRLGIGIDRPQFHERLVLSPGDRLIRAMTEDRLMLEFRSKLRRVAE